MKKVNELEKVIEEKTKIEKENSASIEKCKELLTKAGIDVVEAFKNKVDYKYDDPTA